MFFITSLISSCQSNFNKIEEKNKCFDKKLNELKCRYIYQKVFSSFVDTFQYLKNQKEYFGIPSVVENKIDDAVFFKKDSNECLLIVLRRTKDSKHTFGGARIIRGTKIDTQWVFKISLEYNFEKDFFEEYNENSFKNISKLARYGVLIAGNANKAGCEISDKYWFSDLKK